MSPRRPPPELPPVPPESTPAVAVRGEDGRWVKGRSGNPGGKHKKLREIEDMLDREHRNVKNLRDVFAKLREVAMGVPKGVYWQGDLVATETQYDAAFMKLYLDRVLGPVKEQIGEEDLRDAPQVVLDWIRINFR